MGAGHAGVARRKPPYPMGIAAAQQNARGRLKCASACIREAKTKQTIRAALLGWLRGPSGLANAIFLCKALSRL